MRESSIFKAMTSLLVEMGLLAPSPVVVPDFPDFPKRLPRVGGETLTDEQLGTPSRAYQNAVERKERGSMKRTEYHRTLADRAKTRVVRSTGINVRALAFAIDTQATAARAARERVPDLTCYEG